MPIELVVALIIQVGAPLAMKLIDLYMQNKDQLITPAQWDQLRKEIQTPFENLAGPK